MITFKEAWDWLIQAMGEERTIPDLEPPEVRYIAVAVSRDTYVAFEIGDNLWEDAQGVGGRVVEGFFDARAEKHVLVVAFDP